MKDRKRVSLIHQQVLNSDLLLLQEKSFLKELANENDSEYIFTDNFLLNINLKYFSR